MAERVTWPMDRDHLPTQHTVSHACDEALTELLESAEKSLAEAEATGDEAFEQSLCRIISWIESEQEQREYASHPDERVREAFGYGSRRPS